MDILRNMNCSIEDSQSLSDMTFFLLHTQTHDTNNDRRRLDCIQKK